MGPCKHVLIFNAALSRAGSAGPNLEARASLRDRKSETKSDINNKGALNLHSAPMPLGGHTDM